MTGSQISSFRLRVVASSESSTTIPTATQFSVNTDTTQESPSSNSARDNSQISAPAECPNSARGTSQNSAPSKYQNYAPKTYQTSARDTSQNVAPDTNRNFLTPSPLTDSNILSDSLCLNVERNLDYVDRDKAFFGHS